MDCADPRGHEVKHLWECLLNSCQSQVSTQGQQGLAEGLQEGGEIFWEKAGSPAGEVVLGAQAAAGIKLDHVQNDSSHGGRLYLQCILDSHLFLHSFVQIHHAAVASHHTCAATETQ